MGQIAEDMIDGSMCSLCGCYFKHPEKENGKSIGIYVHDYQVACWDCWDEDCGFEKAEVNTF